MKKILWQRPVAARPVFLMLFGLIALLTSTLAWRQTTGNDFKTNPPKVKRAWIQKLSKPTGTGNAKLFVRFQPDQRLSNSVTLTVPDSTGADTSVTLTDDGRGADITAGDGVFTGFATINSSDLDTLNQSLAIARDRQPKVPVFAGRQQVGFSPVQLVDTASFAQFRAVALPNVNFSVFVDPPRSLLIRNVSVVEDPIRTFNPCTSVGNPNGAWTFGHLMSEMANTPLSGITASTFVRKWLNSWLSTQVINGDSVAARTSIQSTIITPWEVASGVGPGGTLNMSKAPFKLLAIVNRIDLKDSTVYGGSNAGEARFVFCAINSSCNPLPFTVIFEYGINKKGCPAIQNWGQQWVNLQSFTLGSASYNTALQAITDQFVAANADPSKPNKSALNQLRTDETILGSPWELREFKILATGLLTETVVKQTPAISKNTPSDIGGYVNPIAASVVLDQYSVPLQYPGVTPFLGGAAPNPPVSPASNMYWNDKPMFGVSTVTTPNARHHFSLNTCGACHGRETNTFAFTHISPAPFGSPAGLSGFLTGISVVDPVDGVTVRTFNDLLRRQGILSNIVSIPCPLLPFFEIFNPGPPPVE